MSALFRILTRGSPRSGAQQPSSLQKAVAAHSLSLTQVEDPSQGESEQAIRLVATMPIGNAAIAPRRLTARSYVTRQYAEQDNQRLEQA